MQQTLRRKALKGCGEQKAHLVPLPKDTKIQGGLEKGAFLFLTCDTPTFSLSPEYLLPTPPAALNLHTGSSEQ